ncbi:MAG: hypothetical protein Q7S36_01775, partial [Candidatus Liptonbacteria bacterium]|nr:hypothetical protein [Candidatus Liptonbacteria bacterium]
MKYKLQFLTLFAVVIVALLAGRGFAKKSEELGTIANVINSPSLLSAPAYAVTTASDVMEEKIENAILDVPTMAPPKAVFYRVGNDMPPDITAEIAMAADIMSNEKYLDISPGRRWPIASLTKLMTAVVVYERLDLNASTTLKAE